MTIPINTNNDSISPAEQERAMMERIITAVKSGNWEAKPLLITEFTPLLTFLARKRSASQVAIHDLIEAGEKGVFKATKKYKMKRRHINFKIFALDFIEKEMNKVHYTKE